MRQSAERLFLILAMSMMPVAASAATVCSGQIAQLQQGMPSNSDGSAATIGSAPQSIGAQRNRQPTPASIQRAKQDAEAGVEATLDQARQYDAQGKAQACEIAVGRARMMLNP